MKAWYKNHTGERIALYKPPFVMDSDGLFDYEWDYDEGINRIENFRHDTTSRDVNIYVVAPSRRDFNRNMKRFYEVVESDVMTGEIGRIELDTGEYLPCFITASGLTRYTGVHNALRGCKVSAPAWVWYTDVLYSFRSDGGSDGSTTAGEWLDYPHDYTYEYLMSSTVRYFENDYIEGSAGSDFKMSVWGNVDEIHINIGDRDYIVHAALASGDRVEIDSRACTITKYSNGGGIVNLYPARDKVSNVFAKIAPGRSVMQSNVNFDLTVYQERSEPKWNL